MKESTRSMTDTEPETAAIPTAVPHPTAPDGSDSTQERVNETDIERETGIPADGPESSAVEDLLHRNLTTSRTHPYWIGPTPTMALAMVLCMDARVDAHLAFGISPGEIHLIRNAGGVVTDDVIRSLAISQHALGTREVMIVHHTDCGLARLEEDSFRARLAEYAGYRPTWAVQAFKDPHDSVRESLRRVRESPFLIHTHAVRGFIFDVQSGLLEEVSVD